MLLRHRMGCKTTAGENVKFTGVGEETEFPLFGQSGRWRAQRKMTGSEYRPAITILKRRMNSADVQFCAGEESGYVRCRRMESNRLGNFWHCG